MKASNAIILTAIFFLCQCKKDSEQSYSNESIVLDHAQAALYFHTIFREAENVWAFVDSMKYQEGSYPQAANPSMGSKLFICHGNDKSKNIDIQYDAWLTQHFRLTGTIRLEVDTFSYRKNAKEARVRLNDFSINGQAVAGESVIKYRKMANKTNDSYTFTLLEGTVIYEAGVSMPVLISGIINNGQYERIEGSETWVQEDDVWAFSGVMTGMMHENPNLKFTNTVNSTYTVNNETKDGRVYYSMKCNFGDNGLSHIKIPKRSDIIFGYGCSELYFETVTPVN